MLTIEEQIERIADHAFERASAPERQPRRWPALAAAAVVLLTAGSVVWMVSDRDPADIAVAPSETPSLSARLEGAEEYPLTATRIALESDDVPMLAIEEPDTLTAARTVDGTTVFRVSGLATAPGTKVYEAVCAGIPGRSVGCEGPSPGDLPWVLGTPFLNESEQLSIWGDVPSETAAVLITDGATIRWQRPVDGLAVWPRPTTDDWTVEAIDANGTTIITVDKRTQEQLESDAAEAFDSADTRDSDTAVIQQVRDCLVANGATFGADNVRPVVAPGVSGQEIWALCIGPLFDSSNTTPAPSPSDTAVSPAALELRDPSSFGLVEFEDPDATQAVFCSSYSQSLRAECAAFTGTARRSYSDPELPDAPFTVDVTTAFVEDPPTDLNAVFNAPGEITSSSQVVVRGARGELSVDIDGREVIVWEERPGAIGRVTFENRPAGIDPIEIVDALIDDPDQSDEVPYVAIELRGSGDDGALGSLVVVHREGPAECVSVDWVTASNAYGVCATEPLTWWSTVSTLEPGVRGDRDVVFGLTPSDATQVELSVDGGDVITLDTTAVPGFGHRVWAYVIPTQQGRRFSATLTAGSNRIDIDFVHPTVDVDALCAAVDYGAVVPPVVGLPMYQAVEALRVAGVVTTDRLRGDPDQVVLAQSPPPGTEIGCGDTQLTVGTPPTDDTQTSTPEVVAGPGAAVDPVEICGTYTVSAGDFPRAVADRLGVSLESLAAANEDNSSFDSWLVDSVINVPCGP